MRDHFIPTRIAQVKKTGAGVAQWIELRPENQGAAGSIPSLGTCMDCGPGPHCGVCEWQPDIDISLPLFLLPFPSL